MSYPQGSLLFSIGYAGDAGVAGDAGDAGDIRTNHGNWEDSTFYRKLRSMNGKLGTPPTSNDGLV